MNMALWIVQVVLAGMFLMAGVIKVFQYEQALARSPVMSRGLVTFIGVSELLGGLGLLLPALTHILPWLTPLAAVGLAVIMLLATLFHIRRGEGRAVITPIVLLALSAFVVYGRFVLMPL